MTIHTSRRDLLKSGGALVLSLYLPSAAGAASRQPPMGPVQPNAFLRIGADDVVTILSKHIEFGQGPWTGLATLIAEELDADWSQMRATHAPGDAKLYANLFMGAQLTGGSTAMANSYIQMRRTGAAARAMLAQAAANAWGVPVGEITVEKGTIAHKATNRAAGFGLFAQAASQLPVPQDVKLKDPSQFKLIGTDLPRLDAAIKSTGQAMFTLDQREPGMVVAVVAHPPRFGARAVGFDDAEARKVKGFIKAALIPQGVAIYATSTWPALQARKALVVKWDDSAAFRKSTKQLETEFLAKSRTPGVVANAQGDVDSALAAAGGTVVEQTYVFPYLAHAPMEPLDALVQFDGVNCRMRFGSQGPTIDQMAVAAALGVPPQNVSIEVMLAGGSFGRRATARGEFAVEAALVAKAFGAPAPVKLMWTREDDLTGGFYRPFFVHRMQGAIGADGVPIAWRHTLVGQSIIAGSPFESAMVKNGVDSTSVEGAAKLPYRGGAFLCDLHTMSGGPPVLWWRSVGHTHTGFAVETFLDMLLEKAGKDPIDGRLALLDPASREAGVLRAVKQASGWKGRRDGDKAYGVAMVESFNSYVAEVVEIVKGEDGLPKATQVWVAVDCGVAVNPDMIRAQMESGVGYGLSAALYSSLDLDDEGRVVQTNFDGYRVLRMPEAPKVHTVIVKSQEPPTGVGEPGVPPLAPALANAWRALTGVAVTRLPFVRGTG